MKASKTRSRNTADRSGMPGNASQRERGREKALRTGLDRAKACPAVGWQLGSAQFAEMGQCGSATTNEGAGTGEGELSREPGGSYSATAAFQ